MVEAVCFLNEHVYIPSSKNEGLEVCKFCGLVRETENENPLPPEARPNTVLHADAATPSTPAPDSHELGCPCEKCIPF